MTSTSFLTIRLSLKLRGDCRDRNKIIQILTLCWTYIMLSTNLLTEAIYLEPVHYKTWTKPINFTLQNFNSLLIEKEAKTKIDSSKYHYVSFEVFNTWMHNLAGQFSMPSDEPRLQQKTAFSAHSTYPAFRFYSPTSKGYLIQQNDSRGIVASANDPFSKFIEWEWIAQPQLEGAYLRNKETQKFLCFNKHGRPTIRKYVHKRRCLLHGSLPKDLPRSKRSTTKKNSTDPFRDLSHLLHREQHNQLSFLRSDNLTKFAVPSLVHLSTRIPRHRTPWFIGFCRNGRAYANRRPHNGVCRHIQLTRLWNFLLVCPPIHSQCQRPECSTPSRYEPSSTCPSSCRLSIQCGGRKINQSIIIRGYKIQHLKKK